MPLIIAFAIAGYVLLNDGQLLGPSGPPSPTPCRLALIRLGVALIISSAITAIGSGVTGTALELLGLAEQSWARTLVTIRGVGLTLVASWLIFVWVIARLPRDSVPVQRNAGGRARRGRAGRAAAGHGRLPGRGDDVPGRHRVRTNSRPTDLRQRRLPLAPRRHRVGATLREDEPGRILEPAPVIVRPAVTVARPGTATTAGLIGAGALLGALGAVIARRSRRSATTPATARRVTLRG